MLLVFFVDDGAGSLEARPDLFTQIFGYRTYLTILCVQFLQLMEGTDHVGHLVQSLCFLAELRLGFKVLLEVILTCFTVEVEQVIELLYVELVVAPHLIGFLWGHRLDVLELLLQFLELIIVFVGFLRGGSHCLDLLDDVELTLQIGLLLSLLLLESFGALLLDDLHLCLESLFVVIGQDLILLRIATGFQIVFLPFLALGNVESIEGRLQMLHFFLIGLVLVAGNLLDSFKHLLLRGVDLVSRLFSRTVAILICFGDLSRLLLILLVLAFGRLFLVCRRFFLLGLRRFCSRSLSGSLCVFYILVLCLHSILFAFRGSLGQVLILLQGVFLRVHHYTVLSL